jgi:hypothetical protein
MFYGIVMTRDGNGAGRNLFGYIRRFDSQTAPTEIKATTLFGDLLTRHLVVVTPRPLDEVDRLYNEKLGADYLGILRGAVMTIETNLTEKQIGMEMRRLVQSIPDGGDLRPYAFADLLTILGSKASVLAAERLQKAITGLRHASPEWAF